MPELPDVEYLRRYAHDTALGREIDSTSLRDERLLRETSRQLVARRLKGARFDETARHGKHLFLTLSSGGALMLHFGMTGTLRFRPDANEPDFSQLVIRFTDGSVLAYVNKRMLGRIAVVEHVDEYVREHELGPDALGMSRDDLAEVVRGGRGAIKSTLMNQSRIAGLGNVYTDEILYQCGIDPRRPCADVTDEEITTLREQIESVCITAVRCQANPQRVPDSWLLPRREEGASCPGCEGEVVKVTVSGRSTYLCAGCQQ